MFEKKYLTLSLDDVPDFETLKRNPIDEILPLFDGKMQDLHFQMLTTYLNCMVFITCPNNWTFESFAAFLRDFCTAVQDPQESKQVSELIEEFLSISNIII